MRVRRWRLRVELAEHHVHTSKIVLGTMRFSRERLPVNRWASLISDAVELGVTRLHCSSEYESYPLLLEVLEQLRSSQIIAARHASFLRRQARRTVLQPTAVLPAALLPAH